MQRQIYQLAVINSAAKMDAPRTPYAAAKELQARGVRMHTRGGRTWVCRTVGNEAIAITAQARSWVL